MKVIQKPGPDGMTLEGIVEAMQGLSDVRGKVGWFAGSSYPDGPPVALVAATQEYGTGSIPPRPFMRPTIQQEKTVWAKGFADGTRAVLKGRFTSEQVMEQVAGRAAGDVRKAITEVVSPPLNEKTVAARMRKRGLPVEKATATVAKPLVDTGRMLNTLTHQVDKTT